MKKTFITAICLALSWFCGAISASAATSDWAPRASNNDDQYVTLGAQLGYLNGNSTYHTSFYDYTGSGGESKLEFPLQTELAGVTGEFVNKNSRTGDTFKLRITWLTNVGNGSGKMKDSDWLTDDQDVNTPTVGAGYPHPGKDIYSESDIKLKAAILDIRAVYAAASHPGVNLGLVGGYIRRNYHYTVSNTNQVGYGPYAPNYIGFIPGNTLDYDVTYDIPYIGFHSEFEGGNDLLASLDLGYSPLVTVTDKDDHLLRYKRSTGETTGEAYLAGLGATWNISPDDVFRATFETMRVLTRGTQKQTWYRDITDPQTNQIVIPAGATISGIDDRITSTQTTIMFLFTHRL